MTQHSAQYSQLVMPNHINVLGTLFGGQMIAWIDLAAGKAAHRFIQGSGADAVVTRAIKEVNFTNPVFLGEWVNFKSEVVSAGKSSIVIQVKALAEDRNARERLACEATLVMVTIKKKKAGKYVKFPHGKIYK